MEEFDLRCKIRKIDWPKAFTSTVQNTNSFCRLCFPKNIQCTSSAVCKMLTRRSWYLEVLSSSSSFPDSSFLYRAQCLRHCQLSWCCLDQGAEAEASWPFSDSVLFKNNGFCDVRSSEKSPSECCWCIMHGATVAANVLVVLWAGNGNAGRAENSSEGP